MFPPLYFSFRSTILSINRVVPIHAATDTNTPSPIISSSIFPLNSSAVTAFATLR